MNDKPGRALVAKWIDHEAEPQCPPDPRFPNGTDVDLTRGKRPCCSIALQYPAKRIGLWRIECLLCGFTVGVTTAGRADDPKSVMVPCRL